MPIRLRVALLALVAVVGVVAALVFVYRDIRTEVAVLEAQAAKNAWAQESSRLVHMLQRERGSSGGFLVKREADYLALVELNRRNTAASLSALIASPRSTPTLIASARLDELENELKRIRELVDSGLINWVVARDFYTLAIAEILDAIAQEARTGKSAYSQDLSAIGELAAAREAMGLIRATIYYISSQSKPSARDFVDLAIYFGLYRHHIHNFVRDAGAAQQDWAGTYFRSRSYLKVLAIIEVSMMSDFYVAPVDSSLWWKQATQVIDTLKEKEDFLYEQLQQSSLRRIGEINTLLTVFGIGAIILALLITVFAVLTIARIMKALGGLISTFDAVVEKENFSIRVCGETGRDEFGHISQVLNRLLDFTDSLIRDKERLASTDALTGVMNRRSFMKYADREIERAKRYPSEFSLVFIDIDHFKDVNDSFGHNVGDEVLKHFVQTLIKRLRTTDILARWGGEEFVILAPETSLTQSLELAESLRLAVEEEIFPMIGRLTCSLGVAEWQLAESFVSLCQRADEAVYLAKERGRNQSCLA